MTVKKKHDLCNLRKRWNTQFLDNVDRIGFRRLNIQLEEKSGRGEGEEIGTQVIWRGTVYIRCLEMSNLPNQRNCNILHRG